MFMYAFIFSASQLSYQPGVHQSYSGSLVNDMTQQQQSLTKHYPSGNGVVDASMPQHGVVTMGRGVGRGRGRGMSAPARQPNYPPLAVAPTGVGRGIGSFTSMAVCCSVYRISLIKYPWGIIIVMPKIQMFYT